MARTAHRERKKQKASELEHTVAALTTQLEAMQGVRSENSELQDKNLALVGQLRAREEELERLLREQVRRGQVLGFKSIFRESLCDLTVLLERGRETDLERLLREEVTSRVQGW